MNKKQLAIDAAMPVFFIAVALYVIVKAQGMGSEGIFPTLSGGVLLLSAIYILADTVVKKRQVVNLEGVNLVMVLITVAALILYIVLLPKIGYIVDTFILGIFVIRSLGYKKIGITLLCSGIAVLVTFFVFKILLAVPLPMIFLEF